MSKIKRIIGGRLHSAIPFNGATEASLDKLLGSDGTASIADQGIIISQRGKCMLLPWASIQMLNVELEDNATLLKVIK